MAVTYPTEYKATFENVTVLGSEHFQETAHTIIRDTIEEESPSIIAIEQDPARFATIQLNHDNYDTAIDPLVILEEALQSGTPLALIDHDWDDFYDKYTEEEKDKLLEEAAENAGIDPQTSLEDRSLEDIREWNNEVNRLNPDFYNEFVLRRDIFMSRNIAHLAQTKDTVLAIVGHAHMENVAEMVNDILTGDDAGFSPIEPPVFDADELKDITASRDEVRRDFMKHAPISLSNEEFNRVFDAKREQYQKLARDIREQAVTKP